MDISYEILQFADDTLLIYKGNWQNPWSVKSILRAFKLVSRLRENLWKSNLYPINLSKHFIKVASTFLSCKVDEIPFKFIGSYVGCNLRRIGG